MRILMVLSLIVCAAICGAAGRAPLVTLWQMDCGSFTAQNLSDRCYLIRHGSRYMLWDAGLDARLAGLPPQQVHNHLVTLHATLQQQLALLGLKPQDISIVALSHKHFDHIGQAAVFPGATLMVGAEDWKDVVDHPSDLSDSLIPWIKGGASKELVEGDKDIFGDGSVVMLATSGHTPGHHSLLVRLAHLGNVLLTGDLYDSKTQMAEQSVPRGNSDIGATRESYRRFNALAAKLNAIVIIPHDAGDIARLPLFPKAAT